MEEIIYVKLLEEGTLVYRPVKAMKLESNLFKISDKAPVDEVWEFQFNDIVRCAETEFFDGSYMTAVNKVG